MAAKYLMLHCRRCETTIGHTHNQTSHILHLLMAIVTAGLWIIVWAFVSMGNSGPPKCSRCGYSYYRGVSGAFYEAFKPPRVRK